MEKVLAVKYLYLSRGFLGDSVVSAVALSNMIPGIEKLIIVTYNENIGVYKSILGTRQIEYISIGKRPPTKLKLMSKSIKLIISLHRIKNKPQYVLYDESADIFTVLPCLLFRFRKKYACIKSPKLRKLYDNTTIYNESDNLYQRRNDLLGLDS